MADQTTDIYGNLLNTGVNVLGNVMGMNALNAAQQQLATGYGTAGQYVQAAQQQAGQYASPYMGLGATALPDYLKAAQGVGTPYTAEQYKASPYYQAAQLAQQQNEAALRAQAATQGMYGSGNMANALQQNALLTQMQGYQNAQQAELQRQQAAASAMYNPVALGQAAAQNLGAQTMDSAKYMAGLAQSLGAARAGGTLGQNALTGNILNSLNQLGQTALNKYMSGQELTTEEQAFLNRDFGTSVGTVDNYNPYNIYSGGSAGPWIPGQTIVPDTSTVDWYTGTQYTPDYSYLDTGSTTSPY